MIAKTGATSAHNRMACGLVHVDPSVNATETQGLVMRADIVVDSVDFLKSPARNDTLFPEVKIRIHGRVSALECKNLPGSEDSVVKFFFDKPKDIESGDGVIEHPADARPNMDLDTAMPHVTILNKLELRQLCALGAKGGFVSGYEIDAARALTDHLVSRKLVNVPLSVTYLNAAPYIEFVDIEQPHNIEIETKDFGYDLVPYCPISEEMSKSPERVVEDELEPESKPKIEEVSVADIYEKGLVDLKIEQETEPEVAADVEAQDAGVEQQSEYGSGMPEYIGPPGYSTEEHLDDLDEDAALVRDILSQIRGESTEAPKEADEPKVEANDRDAAMEDDQQSRDGELVLDDAAGYHVALGSAGDAARDGDGLFAMTDLSLDDILSGDETDDYVESEAASDAEQVEDGLSAQGEDGLFATIDLPIDNILGRGDEGVSADEMAHRDDVEAVQSAARMDMGNDGAASISEALTNARGSEPDPRFANEFDGLDI